MQTELGTAGRNWYLEHILGYKTALRVAFGLIWLIDALLKWTPQFSSNFESMIQAAMVGQPSSLMPWFNFWANVTSVNPYAFAFIIALVETLLALAVLFGFMRKVTYLLGAVFSLFLWTIPDAFGGFYIPGATDIGASIIYFVVFLFLILVNGAFGPSKYSIDHLIEKRYKSWRRVAEFNPTASAVVKKN